jgi:hypothetical protein
VNVVSFSYQTKNPPNSYYFFVVCLYSFPSLFMIVKYPDIIMINQIKGHVLDVNKMVIPTPWKFPSQQSSTFFDNNTQFFSVFLVTCDGKKISNLIFCTIFSRFHTFIISQKKTFFLLLYSLVLSVGF